MSLKKVSFINVKEKLIIKEIFDKVKIQKTNTNTE